MTNLYYTHLRDSYYAIFNSNQQHNQYKRIASGNMLL